MNILVVSAMFPPMRTGTSFYARNIVQALINHGNNIITVTVKNNEVIEEQNDFEIHRIKALKFNLKKFFKHLRISSIFPSNYRYISKLVKTNNIEIILLVNHYLDIAFPTIYASRKNKVPLFVSVGTQMQSLNPFKNSVLRFLDKFICGNFIFPFCEKIIAWDSEIQRYLKEVQGGAILNKTRIVSYGVNGDYNVFMQHAHNYNDVKQILCVGSVIGQRNYIFIVKIFSEIIKSFPDIKLKIIGHVYDNNAFQLAKNLGLEGKVVFTGEKPHSYVLKEMKQTTIFYGVATGLYAGLGTSTAEAMLLGVPTIARCPSNLFGEENLFDMENFIYSNGITEIDLYNKIKQLLAKPDIREKIGQGGRKFVQENMNWDKVANEMIALFENKI
jgi:glycosyltransferase involved in cell wall biosynthesis